MAKKLRFTGEWPPFQYWKEYPNWEFALDEEGDEDQDETTLRPADVQDWIGPDVSHTVGQVTQADGTVLPALLGCIEGAVTEVFGFVSENRAWHIRCGIGPLWTAFVEDWLPPDERSPSVSFDDPKVFPLLVESRLPRKPGGKAVSFTIQPLGSRD